MLKKKKKAEAAPTHVATEGNITTTANTDTVVVYNYVEPPKVVVTAGHTSRDFYSKKS